MINSPIKPTSRIQGWTRLVNEASRVGAPVGHTTIMASLQ
jgi:hypothetical protein